MKRTVALLLVLALTCVFLVGCSDDLRETIKEHRDEYDYTPDAIEDISLDVYIVCDDYRETDGDLPSNKGVFDAVKRQIDIYTTDTFHTSLVLHYVSLEDYEDTVMNNLDTADLVLVTSKEMMDTLVADDKVADLTDFFASNTYGSLNVTVAEALLEASKYDGKFYAVPNNRTLGSYTYALINKASVHSGMKYPLAYVPALPYVLSLDAAKDEANLAALVRSMIAKELIASKDATALATLQSALFEELFLSVFEAEYAQGATNEETIAVARRLMAMMTAEECLAVEQKLQADFEDDKTLEQRLTVQNITNTESEEYLAYALGVQMAHLELKTAYQNKYLNYGFEDGDRAYPALETLIGRYIGEKTADECTLLTEGDLFTAPEIASLIDYKTAYASYMETDASTFDATEALTSEDVVLVSGAAYEDKAAYEAAGWICNIVSYPTVEKADAFTSAYAVIKQEGIDPERVMQIIYALHTDVKLRNLFLYGIENINYLLDEDVVTRNETALYYVDPIYVGNMFTPYFTDDFTAEDAAFGALQNKDVTFIPEPVPEPEEGGAE